MVVPLNHPFLDRILGPIFGQCQVSGWNCKLSPQCGCIDGKDISRWLKVLILESILDVCRSPPCLFLGFVVHFASQVASFKLLESLLLKTSLAMATTETAKKKSR